QSEFVEHVAAIHNEVTNPALDRIDNHSIEGSDLGSRLGAHVERLNEGRLEAAIVQEPELGRSGFLVHDEQLESNLRAMRPWSGLSVFLAFFRPKLSCRSCRGPAMRVRCGERSHQKSVASNLGCRCRIRGRIPPTPWFNSTRSR